MAKGYTLVGMAMVLLLVGMSLGAAEPALRGYSGLLLAPTADALNRNQYSVSLNSSEISDFEDRGYILNYGLQDNIEGGLLWLHPEYGSTETLINIKHRFEQGSARRASLAVGVTDLTDEIDTSVYVVATKEFGQPVATIGGRPVHMLRVHAGIGSGMLEDFFFGAEARLGRRMTLMAEHVNDQINVGARLRLWRNFTIDAGLLDMDDFALSLSYNYPLQGAEALTPMVSESSSAQSTPSAPAAVAQEPVKPAATSQTPAAKPQPPAPVSVATKELKELTKPTPSAETQVVQHQERANSPGAETADVPAEELEPTPGVDANKSVVEIPLRGIYPDVGSGHMFVPVRPVAEWLGFTVAAQFTQQGLRVTVFAGAQMAEFCVGDDQIIVNGEPTELAAATYLQNNKVTMVPAELFALLGIPVQADAQAGHALFERHDVVGGVFVGK